MDYLVYGGLDRRFLIRESIVNDMKSRKPLLDGQLGPIHSQLGFERRDYVCQWKTVGEIPNKSLNLNYLASAWDRIDNAAFSCAITKGYPRIGGWW
jgi:hypothetical protein